MKFSNGEVRPVKLRLLWFAILVATTVLAVLFVEPFQTARGKTALVSYSRGVLHVSIPYHAVHSGDGTLTIEVLDPEDRVLGHTETKVVIGKGDGRWQKDIRLDMVLGVDDLVWHRVHYRFAYDSGKVVALEGTESISQILRTPVVHILGQQSYLSGGSAAVRVIVTDSKNETIAGAGTVSIELAVGDQKPRVLFTGRLNRRGTTEAQFRFPAGLTGSHQLKYLVDTPIGSTEFKQTVRLEDKVSILLTTEKPIYQPSQTMHMRALALDRSNHEAAANRKLTFEVEDSRGNKVFKAATETDKFGIASAEFGLADEVNLGTYHLRALLGEGETAPTNTAEIALNVERYVLPKFKVAVEFAGSGKKAKRGYRPGDHVKGKIRANYFFGKPVDGAEISVKASSLDVAVFEVGSLQGKTDHDGTYEFDLKLPEYFAGRPLSQGAARVLIEATVKDSAGHAEKSGEPVTVSDTALLITAVPEGGTLIPGLENQIFLLTSYPDGTPARTDLTIHAADNADQRTASDDGGVAVIRIKASAGIETLKVEATDSEGNRASSAVPLQTRGGQDQILLRTERAVYRAGDAIELNVFSTVSHGTAYLDVVKEGQTVLTRDLDIENGRAELTLAATPELAGTVDFNAYLFGRDARPVADHRLVFVQPADELKIEATANAPVYKPGGEARIRFRVTNTKGQGVTAALGLQAVDEAVFALAEKQPGFAKVFFYLEEDVLKPRYEIHSIGMPDVVEPVEESQLEQHDRAARALFSATEMVSANKFETEFGRTVPQTKYREYAQRYQAQFLARVRRLSERLSHAYAESPDEPGDLIKTVESMTHDDIAELRDAWDTNLRVEHAAWDPNKAHYLVHSAGPDKQFGSGDDLWSSLEVRRRKIVGRASSGPSTIGVTIEHDRGAVNGLAEISGIAVDQWGGALEAAAVELRSVLSGKMRRTEVGTGGHFRLTGLPAGSYQIGISTNSGSVSTKLELAARDGAILSVLIRQEQPGTVVAISQTTRMMVDFKVNGGFGLAGGVPGGVMGGVAGGIVGGVVGGVGAPMPPPRPPMAMLARQQMVELTGADLAMVNSATLVKEKSEAGPVPRVRSYFPEALYINPEIITDKEGVASITIPLADSITTWRLAMMASTPRGALGSGTSSLKVFQDFFVDLDLPVTLTQGDRVSIPVAVYNYSGATGDVNLQLRPEDWFSLVDDVAEKTVTVESARVGGSQFSLEAKRIGKFKLTLSARLNSGADRADIVVREIEVIPNGREQSLVFNGRLETTTQHEVAFPAESIPEASKILVRLYPGPLSQVIEGMDSLLRMPYGCFEQTSSSTYPNVLALDYMKRNKKLTPEVHAKAEGFIANGYQRLLTFEVPSGGFSWFGNAPANKILTAYGLMEFGDMSKIHDVDTKLISRTQQWLAAQQQPDGSWKPDTSFINEGATNRYNTDVLRITAYLAWSLENTGYQGPAVERARQFVEGHMGAKVDVYTLAVLANFAVDYGKDRNLTRQAMQLLLDMRTEKDEQAWWSAEETAVYATGTSATVETTGLAAQALLKWGGASGTARKAMTYIAAKKDASGTWGTTQATIMALRALLLASEKGAGDVRGTLEVLLNGETAEKLELTPENNDLLHQFVFKNLDPKGSNRVEIRLTGKGGLAYQVVGQYFLPWDKKPDNDPLSIEVAYDRTHLAMNDIATATASIKNNLPKAANMVMVDLGIPPGFDLLSEDLQAYLEKSAGQKSGRLEKFSLTATQAILYFDSFLPGDTVTVKFRLHAKYPIRARTFLSRVYEYYDPEVSSVARPVQLEVRPH
jgi:uncharacterized protein YfaS (alpha-2-macroglobulin family)